MIQVSTGLKSYPVLRIPVTGKFIGTIQYQPSYFIAFNRFPFSKRREVFTNLIDHDRSRAAGFVVHDFLGDDGSDLSRHFEVDFKAAQRRARRGWCCATWARCAAPTCGAG